MNDQNDVAERLRLKLESLSRRWAIRAVKLSDARLCEDLKITVTELHAAQQTLKTSRVLAFNRATSKTAYRLVNSEQWDGTVSYQ